MRALLRPLLPTLLAFSLALSAAEVTNPDALTISTTDYAGDEVLNNVDFVNPYGVFLGSSVLFGLGYAGYRGYQAVRGCARSYADLRPSASAPSRRRLPPFVLILGLAGASAAGAHIPVGTVQTTFDLSQGHLLDLPKEPGPTVIEFSYRVECDPDADYRAVTAHVIQDGVVREVNLYEYTDRTSITLGENTGPASAPRLIVDENAQCHLRALSTTVKAVPLRRNVNKTLAEDAEALAYLQARYTPFVVNRPDQMKNARTDQPIAVSMAIQPGSRAGTSRLVFTQTWTDEDSKTNAAQVASQMARYGRTTDVEWSWEMEVDDATLQEVPGSSAGFQSGFAFLAFQSGLGHARWKFDGAFLPGSRTPVLYNIARHNVFSDHSKNFQGGLVGYQILPATTLQNPSAREADTIPARPWILQVSRDELKREGKLAHDIDEYLYVKVRASEAPARLGLFHQVRGKVVLEDNGATSELRAEGTLDRLGEDLFGRESYLAIPLGTDAEEARRALARLGNDLHGTFGFESVGHPEFTLLPEETRFYRLKVVNNRAQFEDVTRFFQRVPDTSGAGTQYRF